MSLIAVLNSQTEVQGLIDQALAGDAQQNFMVDQCATVGAALEVLNFDLPEIVLINATDPALDLGPIVESLRKDSWMQNFGIIALYDRKKSSETKVNELLRDTNLLTLMTYENIPDNLFKNLHIIDSNRQIFIQWELGTTLSSRVAGSFTIENDPMVVPVYAGLAAHTLVQRGLLPADRKRDLQIALSELIQNGIEHGHCGLKYDEKMQFLARGGSIADLIRSKCQGNPSVEAKKITLEWDIQTEKTCFFVRDQGEGFDVTAYLQRLRGHTQDSLSGRGIRLAREIGGKLSYNRQGNVARLTIEHHSFNDRVIPAGFEGEEVLVPQKGDVIFRQGEMSDYLFYITSGRFGVYHEGVPIGMLGPADVFMGEMSFLLNNIRTATVLCETPGKIIKVSRRSFVSSLRRYPQYGLFLAKLMARKLTAGNQQRAKQILDELVI